MARIFRVLGANTRPVITDFPDDPPSGNSDQEIRIKHFTEIETFTFLGFVLAHELALIDNTPKPVTAFINVEVPAPELKDKLAGFQKNPLSNEQLADELNDNGLNWEHFVANFTPQLVPGDPLRVQDSGLQQIIDSLDIITEGLVREINSRSIASKGKLL